MSVLDQIIEERDALKSQLDSLRQELRRIVADVYGEHVEEDLEDDEELLGAVENLGEIIRGRDKEIARYRESLKERDEKIAGYEECLEFWRRLFACPGCGSVDGLKVSEPWQRYIRDAIVNAGWGHLQCVKKS